jgi:hypothetical protein
LDYFMGADGAPPRLACNGDDILLAEEEVTLPTAVSTWMDAYAELGVIAKIEGGVVDGVAFNPPGHDQGFLGERLYWKGGDSFPWPLTPHRRLKKIAVIGNEVPKPKRAEMFTGVLESLWPVYYAINHPKQVEGYGLPLTDLLRQEYAALIQYGTEECPGFRYPDAAWMMNIIERGYRREGFVTVGRERCCDQCGAKVYREVDFCPRCYWRRRNQPFVQKDPSCWYRCANCQGCAMVCSRVADVIRRVNCQRPRKPVAWYAPRPTRMVCPTLYGLEEDMMRMKFREYEVFGGRMEDYTVGRDYVCSGGIWSPGCPGGFCLP